MSEDVEQEGRKDEDRLWLNIAVERCSWHAPIELHGCRGARLLYIYIDSLRDSGRGMHMSYTLSICFAQ